ncbi:glycosyltransferase [Sphingobacterium suaedae]|uniref:Glycosyltransferase n=1 Tax=Sphingobacterium suaedae TaxID=1686402 RepID=A0ABW5KLA5_9SPHI
MKETIAVLSVNLGSGGAEKVISLLLDELVADYDVHLFLFENVIHFNIAKGVNVHILGNGKRDLLSKSFSFITTARNYQRLIKLYKITRSISFLTRPNFVNGILKTFQPRIKTIISERCFPSIAYKSHYLRYLLYKLLIPLLYNRADLLFSNSVYINKDLSENFGLKIPAEVIYNPVKINMLSHEVPFTFKETFHIVTVGKLVPIKNHIMILKALSGVSFDFRFHLVGKRIKDQEITQFIDESGFAANVTLHGDVKDVNPYLMQASLFVLSSNSEGVPNVILEAMACGLPVISTNCWSGPLELLNDNEEVVIENGSFYLGKYGVLINTNDCTALTRALQFFYENPNQLKHYSTRSLERVKKYSVEAIYKKFKSIL